MVTLNTTDDALRVSNLRKSYDGNEVVAGIDFRAQRGTCFGLLGPNGAGKTTTLRCCLGLTAPNAGTIHLNGFYVPDDAEKACRYDARGVTLFTIDGDDAKDFDDAVSLEKTENGLTLGVHF